MGHKEPKRERHADFVPPTGGSGRANPKGCYRPRQYAGGGRYESDAYAIERVKKFIRYTYKVKTGKDAGAQWVFDEAMLVTKSGEAIIITRQN